MLRTRPSVPSGRFTSRLLFHEANGLGMVRVSAIDIARIITRDTLEGVALAIGNIGNDFAVQGRNANAGRELRIPIRYFRGLISDIEQVLLVHIHATRLAELVPDMQQAPGL